ncbi:MAG: cobalamin-dependent protein [Desulfococcaceae bacterium]
MSDSERLRFKILEVLEILRLPEHPSRTFFTDEARKLLEWKNMHGISGLWEEPPLMLTATLDDGWGHGLDVIRLYAEAAGVRVLHAGLLRTPEFIIEECRRYEPDILGMTVLQFDTEEALALIRQKIPLKTRIVAGGPLFRADAEFAQRCGIDVTAKDAAEFMAYLLGWHKFSSI